MKKLRKRLMSWLMVFAFVFSTFAPFIPMTVSAATTINEIRLTSSTTSVSAGTLPTFTVSTTTDHVTSIDSYGSNTNWVYWENGHVSWHGFGTSTPTAVEDGTTHYGLNISTNLESGYQFDSNTKIYFNGVEVTSNGHTEIQPMSWGGYIIIDLGTAGTAIPTYTLTFSPNGGNGTMPSISKLSGTEITLPNSVYAPPSGKIFKNWKIDGVEYNAETNYTITGDKTVLANWKDDNYIRESRATMTPATISSNISANDLVFTSSEPSKYTVAFWRVYDLTDTSLNTGTGLENLQYPHATKFIEGHKYAIEFEFTPVSPYEYDEFHSETGSTFYLNDGATMMSKGTTLAYSPLRRIEITAAGSSVTQSKIEFDVNGGTKVYLPDNLVDNGTVIDRYGYESLFKDTNRVTPPTNKELDYLEIDGTKWTDSTYTVSSDITIKAIWKDKTSTQYTITFINGNDSSTINTATVNENEKVTRPTTDPTMTNYTFDNWYADAGMTTPFDFDTPITAHTPIYAKFIPSSVTPVEHSIVVTDGAPDKTSALKNETITITAYSAPSGKEFDKWVVEEGTITLADANNSVTTFTMPDENVKVKATYKDIAVTPTYTIESGANQTYTIDSNVDVVIKASGTKANLSKIQIDGTDLDTANYKTEEGSTILTLKASYLNTLSEGDHTVKFVYNDGDVSTNLKVVKNTTGGNTDPSTPTDPSGTNTGGSTNTGTNTNNNTSSPQTSDNIVFYIMTMLLSLFGIAGASVYVNRKKLFNR